MDDPRPDAVRALDHAHTMCAGSGRHTLSTADALAALGSFDAGASMIEGAARERAFWEGLRQVVREEVAAATAAISRTPPPGVDSEDHP